jgi:MFS family permease
LSDRYDRALLIRCFAFSLALAALPLAIMERVPLEVLFIAGFLCSLVQFCLYPLAVAFSNDHVEGDRRVSLTAMLLVTYGVGASIGPLVAGVLMKLFGSQMLYAFFSFFALVLVWRIRPKAVTNLHQVDDAPLHHVAMPIRGWMSRWCRTRCRIRLLQSLVPNQNRNREPISLRKNRIRAGSRVLPKPGHDIQVKKTGSHRKGLPVFYGCVLSEIVFVEASCFALQLIDKALDLPLHQPAHVMEAYAGEGRGDFFFEVQVA